MNVKVLETNVLHASDVIYWLDGTTGGDGTAAQMQRLERTLTLELESLPNDVTLLHKPGRTALWRRPMNPLQPGLATEAQRTRPVMAAYGISGTVTDPTQRYNARSFNLSVGDGSGHAVVMYPTALGTAFGTAGGLQGSVRRSADDGSVPWALLELEVDTSPSGSMTFRAQTDRKGDFLLALHRLPPLPESVSEYQVALRIRANLAADPDRPLDPDALVAVDVGALNAGGFEDEIPFSLVPGEIRLMRSFGRNYLAVQPD